MRDLSSDSNRCSLQFLIGKPGTLGTSTVFACAIKNAPLWFNRKFHQQKRGCEAPFSNRYTESSAVQVHDLRPGFYKIVNELLFSIGTTVDLRDRTQLRIGAKNQVCSRRCPFVRT